MRSFDVFFDLRLNKRLSKQSWGWWFETPSSPLWRHCNHSFGKVPSYSYPPWLLHWHLANICLLQCQRCSSKGYRLVEHSNPVTVANMTTQNKMQNWCFLIAWRRHQMESFSVLLAICVGNSPVTGEFPAQRPETRNFDVFFGLRLNKRLSKQPWGWWFETPWSPLWRHCNGSCIVHSDQEIKSDHRWKKLL